MRKRHILFVIVAGSAIALSACSADEAGTPKSQISLDEYAKRDCALSKEYQDKLLALQKEFQTNAYYPATMGDTLANISKLYREVADKVEKLGDPPNGEGSGGSKAGAQMMRALANSIDNSAASFRAAKNEAEISAAVTAFMTSFGNVSSDIAELEKKYPTPELDAAEKKIPGCPDKK